LQWFENQIFERCFNRGLRKAGSTMPIYGSQLFLWPPELMNIHVDRSEATAHKPDVILVNGPYYQHENIDIPCIVSSSIRYSWIFETEIIPTGNEKILVLLSFFEPAARFTIESVLQVEMPDKLMFKFHPATPLNNLVNLIPEESEIIYGDVSESFSEIGLLIGSASGVLVEAAAVGIPVIVTRKEGEVNYTYLPDIGRGVLWEEASTPKEIVEAKKLLRNALLHRGKERLAAIEKLRAQLFVKPKEGAIVEMLDLLNGVSLP